MDDCNVDNRYLQFIFGFVLGMCGGQKEGRIVYEKERKTLKQRQSERAVMGERDKK